MALQTTHLTKDVIQMVLGASMKNKYVDPKKNFKEIYNFNSCAKILSI